MMKNLLFALVVVFSCFTLVGCDGWGSKATPAHNAAKQDVVKKIEVAKDFTVTLQEDPSTHTKWMIESKPDFLTLVDENKRTYSGTKQDRRFTFRANAAGTGNLVFVLKGWEANAEVKQRATFPVVVE